MGTAFSPPRRVHLLLMAPQAHTEPCGRVAGDLAAGPRALVGRDTPKKFFTGVTQVSEFCLGETRDIIFLIQTWNSCCYVSTGTAVQHDEKSRAKQLICIRTRTWCVTLHGYVNETTQPEEWSPNLTVL